jgi:hypothetical protein
MQFMGVLRELFGPSRKEIWKSLCEQTGSSYVEGGLFGGYDKVVARHEAWTVVLDTYYANKMTYTRMRAPYINQDAFRFKIYRSGVFSDIAELFGFHDIEIGNKVFDNDFVIKANNEEKVRHLLDEPYLRAAIERQESFRLEVKNDEGIFGADFPEGVDELYFMIPGVVKDIEQLKGLFDIFAEVLDRLCMMGSAYKSDPKIDL